MTLRFSRDVNFFCLKGGANSLLRHVDSTLNNEWMDFKGKIGFGVVQFEY